ncbi:MAG: hypothetical protein J2P17_08665, partial [Mycobacterium sp.]|nr:hypothetical protein [Mycobacterium sp.]
MTFIKPGYENLNRQVHLAAINQFDRGETLDRPAELDAPYAAAENAIAVYRKLEADAAAANDKLTAERDAYNDAQHAYVVGGAVGTFPSDAKLEKAERALAAAVQRTNIALDRAAELIQLATNAAAALRDPWVEELEATAHARYLAAQEAAETARATLASYDQAVTAIRNVSGAQNGAAGRIEVD